MDVSSIAAIASAISLSSAQQEASVLMLKKALDIQKEGAAAMLQMLPATPPAPGGTSGASIDTWA